MNITVLYASTTGNAADCAQRLTKRLSADGHDVAIHDLGRYTSADIDKATTTFVCISTWGDGEPPDDGIEFVDYIKALEDGSLPNLRFSVLGLGDTGYEFFCQCGKDVDSHFERLGGTRIAARVDCDVAFEEDAEKWTNSIAEALSAQEVSQS